MAQDTNGNCKMTIHEALTLLALPDVRRFHEWLNARGLRGRGTHTHAGRLTDAAERLVRASCASCADVAQEPVTTVSVPIATVSYSSTFAETVEYRQMQAEVERLEQIIDRHYAMLGALSSAVEALQQERPQPAQVPFWERLAAMWGDRRRQETRRQAEYVAPLFVGESNVLRRA